MNSSTRTETLHKPPSFLSTLPRVLQSIRPRALSVPPLFKSITSHETRYYKHTQTRESEREREALEHQKGRTVEKKRRRRAKALMDAVRSSSSSFKAILFDRSFKRPDPRAFLKTSTRFAASPKLESGFSVPARSILLQQKLIRSVAESCPPSVELEVNFSSSSSSFSGLRFFKGVIRFSAVFCFQFMLH